MTIEKTTEAPNESSKRSWLGDVQAAHQHQAAQDHDQVEERSSGRDRPAAAAGAGAAARALALELEQHDRRGDEERGDDADQHPMPRRIGRLVIAEPGADEQALPRLSPKNSRQARRSRCDCIMGSAYLVGAPCTLTIRPSLRLALCTHNRNEGGTLMKKLSAGRHRRLALGRARRLDRGPEQEDAGLRRQRRLRLLEGRRGRRQEGPGRAAELQSRSSNIPSSRSAAIQPR